MAYDVGAEQRVNAARPLIPQDFEGVAAMTEKYSTALTQKRLKEVVGYNARTGQFKWLVSRGCVKAGVTAGCKDFGGYLIFQVDGMLYKAHRLAWLYVTGKFPPVFMDHKNRIRDDNRFSNLRLANKKQNCENTSLRSNNTSGIKGVWWHKQISKWAAEIMHAGKKIHLGCYADMAVAARVRAAAERKYFTHAS